MTDQQKPRGAAIYTRETTGDGPEQTNLDGQPRPGKLKKMLQEAAKTPRPFNVLIVTSMTVLGTPSQARSVVEELAGLGIDVETVDGSTV